MKTRCTWLLIIFSLFCATLDAQPTITWNSSPNSTNLQSNGSAMDSGFRFELGVFTDTFHPTGDNVANWAASWNSAERTQYNSVSNTFNASTVPATNQAPFTINKPVYIWGFRGDALNGEWILFRAMSWTWPDAFPSTPTRPLQWHTAEATAILGSINSNKVPFLMKSAAVTQAMPPSTSWTQWQQENLRDVAANGPNDDPDQDSAANLIEFAFGSSPLESGSIPGSTLSRVAVGGQTYLQLRVPRRVDHLVGLTVEVSSDLQTWQSGEAHSVVVENSLAALVVRDLTAISPSAPKRFMRVKASLQSP